MLLFKWHTCIMHKYNFWWATFICFRFHSENVILFVGCGMTAKWIVNFEYEIRIATMSTVYFINRSFSLKNTFLFVSFSFWYLTLFILLWKMWNGLTLLVKQQKYVCFFFLLLLLFLGGELFTKYAILFHVILHFSIAFTSQVFLSVSLNTIFFPFFFCKMEKRLPHFCENSGKRIF